jgi:hypothetical protein
MAAIHQRDRQNGHAQPQCCPAQSPADHAVSRPASSVNYRVNPLTPGQQRARCATKRGNPGLACPAASIRPAERRSARLRERPEVGGNGLAKAGVEVVPIDEVHPVGQITVAERFG